MRRVRRSHDGPSLCGRMAASAVQNKTNKKKTTKEEDDLADIITQNQLLLSCEIWGRKKKACAFKKAQLSYLQFNAKALLLIPPKASEIEKQPEKTIKRSRENSFCSPRLIRLTYWAAPCAINTSKCAEECFHEQPVFCSLHSYYYFFNLMLVTLLSENG